MIITDVFERSAILLASQFQTQLPNGQLTNLQKLIAVICSEGQIVQDQIQILLTQRALSTSVGAQLDGIGQIVGLARNIGQPDDTAIIDGVQVIGYRESLEFQIIYNASQATPEEIIYITQFITSASHVIYAEYYPAAYQVIINEPIVSGFWNQYQVNTIPNLLKNAGPAGVAIPPITTTMGVPTVFNWSSDVLFEPMYASKDDQIPPYLVPFYVNSTQLYVQRGETTNPPQGGGFSEDYGYEVDTKNAGQIAEVVVVNGNLPI